MHALVFIYIYQRTIFKVLSFTDSKDMIGAKIKKPSCVHPDDAH